jgi:hypothetical protein
MPFDLKSGDPQKWMEAHLYEAVRSPDKFNPEIGPKLAHIISKMLEKSCAKRFSDWTEITALLEQEEPRDEANRSFVNQMLEKRVRDDATTQATLAEAGRGINLLLLEEPGEIYGNWIMFFNRQSALSREQGRPQPFAFDLDELEREVNLVGVMHIYETEKIEFDVDRLKQFVADFV